MDLKIVIGKTNQDVKILDDEGNDLLQKMHVKSIDIKVGVAPEMTTAIIECFAECEVEIDNEHLVVKKLDESVWGTPQ
jgi:hypothetical protein